MFSTLVNDRKYSGEKASRWVCGSYRSLGQDVCGSCSMLSSKYARALGSEELEVGY